MNPRQKYRKWHAYVSRIVYWSVMAALCLPLYHLGTMWLNHDYRFNLHENGHLSAYEEDGVHAYRESLKMVISEEHTVNGLKGGYLSEVLFLRDAAVFLAIAAGILWAITGLPWIPLLALIPQFTLYQLHHIMQTGATDIGHLRILMRLSKEEVISQIIYPPGFVIHAVAILVFVVLFLDQPPTEDVRLWLRDSLKPDADQPNAVRSAQSMIQTYGQPHPATVDHSFDHVAPKHTHDETNVPSDPSA